MDQVAENANKARRFQSLELKLIGARGLPDLINAVIDDYKAVFELDVVTLALMDPEHEIRRVLESNTVSTCSQYSIVYLDDEDHLQAMQSISLFPRLGRFNQRKHGWLFPRSLPRPNSVAILPLIGHGRILGSLNLGSLRRDRFVSHLGADFLERMAAIASLCFENTINHERLKKIGLTDPLTGVYNRRFFEHRLKEEVSRVNRSGKMLSCLFFDIDHFKSVNDTHGHQNGDLVLRDVAALISSHMRLSDILVRYGGEEFAALLLDTGLAKGFEIAERIRQAVAARPIVLPSGQILHVTLSIGVARYLGGSEQALVHEADLALLSAKRAGRNKVITQQRNPHTVDHV